MVRCFGKAGIEVTTLDNPSSWRRVAILHGDFVGGDPGTLVADFSCAKSELGWTPQYVDLATIVEHAWQWEQVLANE